MLRSIETHMHERLRHPVTTYGLAVLATLLSLLIRWPLWPVLGDAVPNMTFFPAVMIAAYVGGFWPGVVATVLSAGAGKYFLEQQPPSFHFSTVNQFAAMLLFVLVGTIISGLCESLHRVRKNLVAEERRRADEAMREIEQRFRQLVENIHEVFWISEVQTDRMLYVSPGYEEITGRTVQSLYERPESRVDAVHPDDRDRVKQYVKRRREGVFSDMEYRMVRTDGSIRWVRNRAFPIRDEHGQMLRVAGLLEDITDRKRVEDEFRESEHRWRSLTEALPQLVWTAMPDGACDYFSTQWEQYTGVPASELLGWQWMKTLHPDDCEPTREFWTDSVAGRHGYDVEYRVRRSDGEYRWFKTRGVPIRDSDDRIFKWFGSCTDITDGKLAAEELRLAKEAAESANRAKDEFLANVSHEIRTPMNAIMGLTSLVLGTELNDGQRQSLTTVKSAADNLLGIINDLLDFSKIEAGKLELHLDEFGVRATLGDTLRALAVRAGQKGLELVSDVQPDVPDVLIGDAGRLRQVLLNLVGNAIKFTERGEVLVHVSAISDAASKIDDSQVHLLFTVRDTGIGISREKQATIFRAFEQEDSSTTRKFGGTGLGLTISAQLAALMGGKIEVESEPGHGSTFSFMARFGRSSARRAADVGESSDRLDKQRAPQAAAAPLRILVAEDNEFNVLLLKELFAQRGHSAHITSSGREAVALATGDAFDLLLLDIHMPEMDGFAVAHAIREQERSSEKHLPIIAFTARTGKTDRQRCLDAGMDDFLSKPVQAEALWEVIDRVIAARALTDNWGLTLLDPRAILAACGGDAVILEKICQAFRATVPDQMTRVRRAFDEKDAPNLREAAHSLCSTLAAFSTIAGTAASNLEDEAARGQIEPCGPMVARLETICSKLVGQTADLSMERLSL